MIKEKSDFYHRVENDDYHEYCLLMERCGKEPWTYSDWLDTKSKMDVFYKQDAAYELYKDDCWANKEEPLLFYDWLKKWETTPNTNAFSDDTFLQKESASSDTPTFDAIHNFNFDNVALPELLYRTYISLSSFPDPNAYDVKLRRRLEQELKDMANTEDLTIDAFTGMSSSTKDLRKELTAAEEQIFKLTTEVDQLTAERDRAVFFKQEAEKETNRLGRLNIDLQYQVEEVQRSYDELAISREQLNKNYLAVLDANESFERTFEERLSVDLKESNDQLRVTVKSLTEDLETERNAWDHKTNVLRSENESLRGQLHGLEQELSATRSALDMAIGANENLATANGKRSTPANQPKYPHYFVEVPNVTHVDISWVLRAFSVPCCEGHAIKKLLAAGKRGAKDKLQDLKEARDSITRAIEMEEQQ